MFNGVWQLANLNLSANCRRSETHGQRIGLAMALYLVVVYFRSADWKSASGLELFQSQLQITFFYFSFVGVFDFSQAITEEKEEDTLGLMRLANISPLSVILGKLASTFCDAGLLLALQFPFTIVAITLGGISWPQVIAAYVALATYLWMLVCVGLLASVVRPTGIAASGLTSVIIGTYILVPLVLQLFRFALIPIPAVGIVFEQISLSVHLIHITESGFSESPWCAAVGFGLITGLLCLCLSCFLFDRFALSESHARVQREPKIRQRSSRRSWSRPIVWREYFYCSGGLAGTLIRVAIPLAIFLSVFALERANGGVAQIGFTFARSAVLCGLIGLLDCTGSACRIFQDEVRFRTWSSIVQTPSTLKRIVWDKYVGCALGLAPTMLAPFLFAFVTLFVHDYFDEPKKYIDFGVATMTVGICCFGYLHLLVLLSLYFGWKATPMTLTVCFTIGFFYVREVSYGWPIEAIIGTNIFTDVLVIALMIGFHVLIMRRLTQLAEIA